MRRGATGRGAAIDARGGTARAVLLRYRRAAAIASTRHGRGATYELTPASRSLVATVTERVSAGRGWTPFFALVSGQPPLPAELLARRVAVRRGPEAVRRAVVILAPAAVAYAFDGRG